MIPSDTIPSADGQPAVPYCHLDLLAAPQYNLLTISGAANRHTWRRIEAALHRLGSLLRPTVLRLDAVSELDEVALCGLVESAAERRRRQQPPILLRSVSPAVAAALADAGWQFTHNQDLTARATDLLAG